MTLPDTLSSRREFLFCYDIKMGNPNGDPDENRPRVLPDKTHYVTDVRLKRFVRDFFKIKGRNILVDTIEGKTTNLTGRVAEFLAQSGTQKVTSSDQIVEILLAAFVDARLFGSTFAFKTEKGSSTGTSTSEEQTETSDEGKKTSKKEKGKAVKANVFVEGQLRPVEWVQPKTLTGAVQISHGEVKHNAQEVDIEGTSIFGSDETKGRGTFTSYHALRYALVAFNGVANQHSARISKLTDTDYSDLLQAMWYGVRSAGNTRTKRGQIPRMLVNVVYKPNDEFQFGNLADYIKLNPRNGKVEKEWSSPDDYTIDVARLLERLGQQAARIARLEFCLSPDVTLSAPLVVPGVEQINLNFDTPSAG